MDVRCRIDMLGGLRVRQGEREITRFRTEKTAALLAFLAYHLDHAHPREVLAELLWPWSAPGAGRTTLRVALSSLRRQLEPPGVPAGTVIRADRNAIRLNPETVATDVREFEAAVRSAEEADSDGQHMHWLTEAVEAYGGQLLPGLYQEWIVPEQERLSDLHFGAVKRLARLLHASGETDRAIDHARRAVSADPLREEAHQEVIRLLSAAGRAEAACQQYEALERILLIELGAAPSALSRQLLEDIPPVAATQARSASGAVTAPVAGRPRLPTGTVTFLLTDIEGSTRLRERSERAFAMALDDHHRIVRECIGEHSGREVKELGDGFIAVFEQARDAFRCAVDCQQALDAHAWPSDSGPVRVRMALYTGDVELQGTEYRGRTLHHASRLLAAGHGGQILCSEVTKGLVGRHETGGVELFDLGIYRLRDIQAPERVYQVSYPGMAPDEFPPLRAELGLGSQLPLPLTRFVGREPDLARLRELLLSPETRLVTLAGPGGSGKTRLAIETSRSVLQSFRGAVWFVALQDVADGALLPGAITDAMHLPRSGQSGPLAQAVEVLSRQPSVLVLDNLEQIVDEAAPLVGGLLTRVPTLKCLVTSRQRLNVSGEVELWVPPLPIPTGEPGPAALAACESVQLFVDRAQTVRSDFQITAANAAAIAELCRRLEGMPLALELAATWANVLTPTQMLAQLENRFDFLVSRRRDIAERHRTLQAAIEWSYELLPPNLQDTLAELSVFRGGWSADAAEGVCSGPAVLDALLELCDHSLVSTQEVPAGMRFQMLDSIREFAATVLEPDRGAGLSGRHAACFLDFARERSEQADGPEEARAFAELEADLGNLRAAMDWAVSAEQDATVAGLAAALCTFLWRRGYWQEHDRRVAAGLAAADRLPAKDIKVEGQLLQSLARLAYDRGEVEAANDIAGRGIDLARGAGSSQWEAAFLNLRALTMVSQGELGAARGLLERSLPMFREAGDTRGEGMALHNLGVVAYSGGEAEAAGKLYGKALPIRERAEDLRGTAETQNNMGLLAEADGRLEEAEAAYREALRAFVQLGDVLCVAVSLCNIGEIALRRGEPDEARDLIVPAAHALGHLGSAHMGHARALLTQTSASSDAPNAPWRDALKAAADRVLTPGV